MHNRILRSCCIAVTAVILASCATAPPPAPLPSPQQKQALWQQHKRILSSIAGWRIRGKIGVKTGAKGGSASLKWQYHNGTQKIELYGPLGGGRVIITTDKNGAELRDTKGRVIKAGTASAVLYQRLGWQVPFDQLVYWVRGLPAATTAETAIVLNQQARIGKLRQGGWQVDYQDYQQQTHHQQDLTLPTRLTISAIPGAIEIYSDKGKYLGDQLSVKIILKSWSELQLTN